MAAASRGNPKLAITDPDFLAQSQLTLTFVAAPPSITPDITRTPHTLAQPQVLTAPSAEALQRDYPAAALAAHIAGQVVLGCQVTLAGKLADCAVLRETPAGQDFAAAALRLSADFVLRPMLRDGEPAGGGKIILPIAFGPH
jgi:TonB family protein